MQGWRFSAFIFSAAISFAIGHDVAANPLIVDSFEVIDSSGQPADFVDEISVFSGINTNQTTQRQPADYSPEGLFSIHPTAAFSSPVSEECQPKTLEMELRRKMTSEAVANEIRKKYFQRCEKLLNPKNLKGARTLIEFSRVEYDIFANPFVREVRIHYQNGDVSHGFMGLKPGKKKRPLIVVKCGLFCEGRPSTTTKTMLMHLFDESPFNVLILGSHTGTNNIRENKRLVFGGFFEGQEIMAVGQWVRTQAPFKEKVSSLHLMGISLGGSAALFAALYNDNNFLSSQIPIFNSAVAYCPVVNVEPTIHSLYRPNYVGFLASLLTWRNLLSAGTPTHELSDIFRGPRPAPEQMPEMLGSAATRFLNRQDARSYLLPYRDKKIENLSDFWRLNDFTSQVRDVQTPTLVWGSRDDIIVNNKYNAGFLDNQLGQWPGNVQVLNLGAGSHCGFSMAYGWQTASTVLRSFFLSHDNEVTISSEYNEAAVDFKGYHSDAFDIHVNQEWLAHKGKNYFTVKFSVWNKYANNGESFEDCRLSKPFDAPPSCYEKIITRVWFSELPLPIQAPDTKTSAEVLTRWANTQLKIMSAGGGGKYGGGINGTGAPPMYVGWFPEAL